MSLRNCAQDCEAPILELVGIYICYLIILFILLQIPWMYQWSWAKCHFLYTFYKIILIKIIYKASPPAPLPPWYLGTKYRKDS